MNALTRCSTNHTTQKEKDSSDSVADLLLSGPDWTDNFGAKMKNYHDLLQHVLDHGQDQFNTRTGKVCRALVGCQLQYNLADGCQ